jgi:diguanylate cyclase (GGDEF)-like protein
MTLDVGSLLIALTVNMVTIAVALPAVMGKVNTPARRVQIGAIVQAVAWVLLLASETVDRGSMTDRVLSTLSMAGIASGVALYATAFNLWCGHPDDAARARWVVVLAVALPLGYCVGFSNYAFRVGWANGLAAVQMMLVVVALTRRPAVPVGRWRWLVVFSMVLQSIFTAWRGVIGAFQTELMPEFLAGNTVNVIFALAANTTAVLSFLGILLAHRDEAARALEQLAMMDGLTGVLNRRAWMVQAEQELARGIRYGNPVTVLMLDLDHFKQINDRLGHAAGDRALCFVAAALKASARTGDLVGRYGGEEFCVMMSHALPDAAVAFDRRMREQLNGSAAAALGHALDYSAGTALRRTGDTLESLLKRADDVLYQAKAQGRGRTLDDGPWHPPAPPTLTANLALG